MWCPILIICLFSLCAIRTYAEDGAAYPSPDGRFSISTASGSTTNHHTIGLIDLSTRNILASYDREVRAITVLWSPDSQFVAINEDISHECGHLSIWHLKDLKWEPVYLPQTLRSLSVIDDPKTKTYHSEEVINRLLPKDEAKLIRFWWGSHDPTAVKWLNGSDLQIEVDGEGSMRNGCHMSAGFSFIIHCLSNCTAKVVEKKQLHLEITQEQNPDSK